MLTLFLDLYPMLVTRPFVAISHANIAPELGQVAFDLSSTGSKLK
jgi:hypothetical protein